MKSGKKLTYDFQRPSRVFQPFFQFFSFLHFFNVGFCLFVFLGKTIWFVIKQTTTNHVLAFWRMNPPPLSPKKKIVIVEKKWKFFLFYFFFWLITFVPSKFFRVLITFKKKNLFRLIIFLLMNPIKKKKNSTTFMYKNNYLTDYIIY